MIFQYLLNSLQSVVIAVIGLFPTWSFTSPDVSGIATGVSVIIFFIGTPLFISWVSSTLFWLTANPVIALVKFIYRKIPGVS